MPPRRRYSFQAKPASKALSSSGKLYPIPSLSIASWASGCEGKKAETSAQTTSQANKAPSFAHRRRLALDRSPCSGSAPKTSSKTFVSIAVITERPARPEAKSGSHQWSSPSSRSRKHCRPDPGVRPCWRRDGPLPHGNPKPDRVGSQADPAMVWESSPAPFRKP